MTSEHEPTPSESAERQAVVVEQTGRLSTVHTALISGALFFGVVATMTSVACLLVMKKNDLQGNNERRAIFELCQQNALALKNLGTDFTAYAKDSTETAAKTAEKQKEILDGVQASVKSLPADTAKSLQPILSNIGIAVTDRVAAEIAKTAEERSKLAQQVAAISDKVSTTGDRLAAVETAIKAATAQSEETRTSVAATTDRLRDAMAKGDAEGTTSKPVDDLQKSVSELRASQIELLNQVKALNARMARGL